MIYQLSNDILHFKVSSHGAEMQSLSRDGREFLWQGDKRYWADRALTLFPFLGRLYKETYTLSGVPYKMKIHGFALSSDFKLIAEEADRLVFELTETPDSLKAYPFPFSLKVSYELKADTLLVRYTVTNLGARPMPYAIGGHPGFFVPGAEGLSFDDYSVSFPEREAAERILFSQDDILVTGEERAAYLFDGDRIRLYHGIFDEDAIFLKGAGSTAILYAPKDPYQVEMHFSGMPVFGLWHVPRTDAPFVCMEPWTAIPGRQDVFEDLYKKEDMTILQPDETDEHLWSVSIRKK